MAMVKMQGHGITTDVYPADVDFYKRAGYEVVEDVPAEPAAPEKPLEKLTVVELKELAEEKGIEGFASMNKAELVAALKE